METFDFIKDSNSKEKDGEIPYFDMESEPKIPFYKKRIFLILVFIILIVLIVIVILIFTVFLRDKCDIENGYYIPEDKTEEKKCLKCDLNCKTCH
jgi:flagellar basal body-associated protein FliL